VAKTKSAIIAKFKVSDVAAKLNTTTEKVVQSVIETFEYVGEQCVKYARDNGKYNDITGNLRSSIGYAILRAGKIVKISTSAQFSGEKGDGSKGVAEAEAFLRKFEGMFPKGIALVLVAGMDYAVYVEAMETKDVLTGAYLKAEKLVPMLLAQIGITKK
jgi:hypothetical protein